MAIKLNMSKAYGRVEWNFIMAMLDKLGFISKVVDFIMECVKSVKYNKRVWVDRPRERNSSRRSSFILFVSYLYGRPISYYSPKRAKQTNKEYPGCKRSSCFVPYIFLRTIYISIAKKLVIQPLQLLACLTFMRELPDKRLMLPNLLSFLVDMLVGK